MLRSMELPAFADADDDSHCTRGCEAMEEDCNGDVCGATDFFGEVEASAARAHNAGKLTRSSYASTRWMSSSFFDVVHSDVCGTCAYVHGVAARGIHYLHRPGPVLQDLGFSLLPELGPDKAYVSETLFSVIFFSFILWTFHPFIYHNKRFYTLLLWIRVLAILATCQGLRIITFYSTHLPGPNYHCREGSKYATLAPPERVLDLFLINVRGVLYGCGDLIFSSHMIFTLVFVRTYYKYGSKRFIKMLAWLMAVILSLLIIASRKHYTVDVVVAWYTANLVVFLIETKFAEMPDRTNGSQLLLPLVTKEKDNRSKEETHKLLNGNSVDTHDRRYRTQANHLENGNHVHSETAKNDQ